MTDKQPIKALRPVVLAIATLGAVLVAQPSFALTIDNFNVNQAQLQADSGTPVDSSSQAGATSNILGGERDVTVTYVSGTGGVRTITETGAYAHSTDSGNPPPAGHSIIVWDGVGVSNCPGTGLGEDFSNAINITVDLIFADLNTNIDVVLVDSTGASSAVRQTVTQSVQVLTYDIGDFAAVNLANICAVELQVNPDDQLARDVTVDDISIQIEQPEIACSNQSFGGNVTSAGEGVDVEKTFTMTAANLPSAGCPNLVVSETVTCTGLDLAITEAPAGCTLSGGPDTYTITCAGGLTNGSNPFTFLTQYTGDNGSCTVAMQSATCDGTPATISPACSASISRVPPPPAVPAIAPIGLAAALIGLPLAGVFFARRRRRS
jgi:hypothetical protein